MSFLSRIKEMGKTKGDDEIPSEALSTEGMVSASGAQVVDTEAGASTIQPGSNEAIISESAPSEFPADYQRPSDDISEASLMEPRSGLPLVGHLKLDRQQRVLGIGLAVGVLGLVLSAALVSWLGPLRARADSMHSSSTTASARRSSLCEEQQQCGQGVEQARVQGFHGLQQSWPAPSRPRKSVDALNLGAARGRACPRESPVCVGQTGAHCEGRGRRRAAIYSPTPQWEMVYT